jgi:hypothetical protein
LTFVASSDESKFMILFLPGWQLRVVKVKIISFWK